MATTFEKESFLDLQFNNEWVSKYGLVVVSDGSRYTETLFPNFTHTATIVPGRTGTVYWGTTLNSRTVTKRLVTDGMTSRQYASFKNNFKPGTYAELRLSESAYKYAYAYVGENTNFSFVPFETTVSINGQKYVDTLYKGECELVFFLPDPAFYSDYHISLTNGTSQDYTQKDWFIESGLPIADWLNKEVAGDSNARIQLALGNWFGGNPPASARSIKYYHAGNANARANLSFKRTYGSYATDSTFLDNIWTDYEIDDLIITIPRAIKDIKYVYAKAVAYKSTWDVNKPRILEDFEDNLDSSIAGVLRSMARATGATLKYSLVDNLLYTIRENFINNKTYVFSINAIELQSRMRSLTELTNPMNTPETLFRVDDNISDSINNKYITLLPSFGAKSDGTLDYRVITIGSNSPTLIQPELYFRNTYE